MKQATYDVIQIGYGPVSESLALMLGRQGRSVAVCERWTTRYPLPRAVCIDHELYRVLAANGMGDVLPSVTHPGPLYQWFNADWKELLVIDWQKPSISGGPEVNFVHQPTLEAALDDAVRAQPSVDLHLGWEMIALSQDDDLAHATVRHVESGEETLLSARYIVGCDGANSIVREAIGGGQEDRGFEADWLVIDVLMNDGVTVEQLGIPEAGQYCNPTRPTTIVPAGIRDGRKFRRWEFMRLPGETVQELEDEDFVWKLLKPWAGPEHVQLVRHKVYNFRSLMAERWRDRRLLIAGDAAHVMPPFMGQGMCAGLRDTWNLAWKLGLVLDDKADDRLLDTYQAAAERDRTFLGGNAPPMPPFPKLIDGLLYRPDGSHLQPGAGLLSPHGAVDIDGQHIRLDDAVNAGSGFVVIARGFDPERTLNQRVRDALSVVGTRYVALSLPGPMHATADVEGRLDAFLDANGWAAMIVRPDFYIYGGVEEAEDLAVLTEALIADLNKTGLCLAISAAPCKSMCIDEACP